MRTDRIAGAVIFVIELDVARIFFSDRNVWHGESSLVWVGCKESKTATVEIEGVAGAFA